MTKTALILTAALIAAPVQAQEVCDQACYNGLQQTISDLHETVAVLRNALNDAPPGGAAGGALREEVRQCQQDRVDLFAVIDALKAKLADPESTELLERWGETEHEVRLLRIAIVERQSELLGALSTCFHSLHTH